MKPYPAYKDSGVEWIGEIPEHWDVVQIKRLSPVKRGASPRPIEDPKYFDDNGEFAWVRIADVSSSDRYLESTTQTLSELGASLSIKRYPGDLFLSIAGTVGKPIITTIKCCIHDGFVWFPNLKINPEYLYYIFSAGEAYKGLGKWGTQLNLNTETVGSIPLPFPPEEVELEGIINFLDYKTSQIDTLIEKKQKQIELLKEERTAIINQAVTKGLNPDVPMKDSGIEWLGEVPEHWNITKLKRLLKKIGSGVTPKGGAEVYQEEGVPIIRSQNVYFEGLKLDDVAYISEEIHRLMSRSAVEPNDVLINITGASIGRCTIVPDSFGEANVNQHVCILRPQSDVNSDYLHLFLSSDFGQLQVWASQNGAAREGLNYEQLGNFWIPLPSVTEQKDIVQEVRSNTDIIFHSINLIDKQITHLQEYRTALISEAVTGKIDVRDTPTAILE